MTDTEQGRGTVKDIPIDKETVVDRAFGQPLGPVRLNLPEGQALCHDAASMTVIEGHHDRQGHFIAVIAAAEHGGELIGSIMPMSPESARGFAASLYAAADRVDGGQVTN